MQVTSRLHERVTTTNTQGDKSKAKKAKADKASVLEKRKHAHSSLCSKKAKTYRVVQAGSKKSTRTATEDSIVTGLTDLSQHTARVLEGHLESAQIIAELRDFCKSSSKSEWVSGSTRLESVDAVAEQDNDVVVKAGGTDTEVDVMIDDLSSSDSE